MRRSIAALAILALATPALAETDKQRKKRCAAQAEIVGQAVEMRSEKTPEPKVTETLSDGVDARLAPTVPLLVGYVFTLKPTDLTPAVRDAFERQCNDFKP